MKRIDAVGPMFGMFRQSAGAQAGFASTLTTSFNLLGGSVARPGKMWNLDFGRGQVAAVATYGMKDLTVFSLQEDTREPAGVSRTNAIVANFWQSAADNVLSTYPYINPADGSSQTLQQYCLQFVQYLIDSGYTFAPIRINREASGGLSNDAPLVTTTDSANSVTFFLRVIPLMRQLAAANGLTLYIIWNACGGPEASNNDILLGFPGWDYNGYRICDALGPDIYANTAVSGIFPVAGFDRWVYSDVSVNSAVGATTLTRISFQVSPAVGDVVEIGTGTPRMERATVASTSGANITFTAPLTQPHIGEVKNGSGVITTVGDTIIKVYPVGAKVSHFGQTYISLVANNVGYPSPFPQGSTSAWRYYPYKPTDGSAGTPGVDCMTLVERQAHLDAWTECFNLKFHGVGPTGTQYRWYADKWYEFARTGIAPAGEVLDSRVAAQTPRRLDFCIPEFGAMGYPSWNSQSLSGGDCFGYMQAFVSWCVAKKLADPDGGVKQVGVWDHDNGVIPTGSPVNSKSLGFTSVYSVFESRASVYANAPAAYFPLSGRVLTGGWHQSAQPTGKTGRLGLPVVGAKGMKRTPLASAPATGLTRSGSSLLLNGAPVRLAGMNAYDLGLTDNAGTPSGSYLSHGQITAVIQGARQMGANLVRCHTIGMSSGTSKSFMTGPTTFVDANLDAADWAIYQAKQNGLLVWTSLVDNWNYYHGGKWNFVHWAYQQNPSGLVDTPGITKDDINERVFFANTAPGLRVRALFKTYISAWLNHVNPYTGLAYKDDPTLAVIETGNEVYYAAQLGTNEWTQDIASYVKSIAPGKLVADGSAASGQATSTHPGLTAAAVDIVGAHYYPADSSWQPCSYGTSTPNLPAGTGLAQLTADANAASSAGKVFIVGEYAWTRTDVASFYAAVQGNSKVNGDMAWSIIGNDGSGVPLVHGGTFGGDDYPVHRPYASGNEATYAPALASHISTLTGIAKTGGA